MEEFAETLDLQQPQLTQAFDVFREELTARRKTLAHRTADLALGLQRAGLDHAEIVEAVRLLAQERRQ